MASAVLDVTPAAETQDGFQQLRELPAARRRWEERFAEARPMVADVLALPAAARAYWQRLIRHPSAELHANRDAVRGEFDKLVEYAALTAEVVPAVVALAGRPLPEADGLPAARQDLSQFVETILTRWTSLEELEELMVDTFELPKWLTKGPIPPHLRPPPSWYAETTDPTRPAAG